MVERSSTFTGGRSVDRTVGAVVTISLAVFVARQLSRRSTRSNSRDEEDSWFYALCARLFNLVNSEKRIERGVKSTTEENVLHRGACHCRSVAFELYAPPTIVATDGNGKIHYPHIRIPADDFLFIEGGALKMYYVSVPAASSAFGVAPTMAAYSFCSKCGVHVLHAPNSKTNELDVNVDLLNNSRRIEVSKQRSDLSSSSGIPLPATDETIETPRAGFLSLGPLNHAMDGTTTVDDDETSDGWRSKSPTPVFVSFPGTPCTEATNGTDSLIEPAARRMQPLSLSDSASAPPMLPPKETGAFSTKSDLSLQKEPAATVTPTPTAVRREKLKYYMSKHISPSSEKKTSAASVTTV